MKRSITFILLLFAFTTSGWAQVSQTAVQFLLIAPGARAGGMGETFVAISDDATAVHWNPAGLGRYPLSSEWIEFKVPKDKQLSDVVIVDNGMPESNYLQYDIWGLLDGRLARWDGVSWISNSKKLLPANSTLEGLVENYTGLEKEQAAPYVDKLAREINPVTPEEIDQLESNIKSVTPSDYVYLEDIDYGFQKLRNAYQRLRIDSNGFKAVKDDIDKAVSEKTPSTEILDKIAFGFDRAITTKGDREIMIPFDLVITDPPNCIGTDNENIYIGTNSGLFKFDPDKLKWWKYSVESDSALNSNVITSLASIGKRSMVIGTSAGVVKFNGRKFIEMPNKGGVLPGGNISALTARSQSDIWAVSDNILYHFDGQKWSNSKSEEISIGEDLGNSIVKFYGLYGMAWKNDLMAGVAQANTGGIENVETGQIIELPYSLGYKGEITDISTAPNGDLWIGTTQGIVKLAKTGFFHYGYKVFNVTKDNMSAREIAGKFIPSGNESKIAQLADKIENYNNLDDISLAANDKALVYSNSLGSRISTVKPVSGNKTYVATEFGVVEYSKGNWKRVANAKIAKSEISDIYKESGEVWFAAKDQVTVYANPKRHITFMHSNYLVELADDLYYEYLSLIWPTTSWGTFGGGITFLSYGSQEGTDEFGNPTGTFSSYDIALTLSYGTKVTSNFSGGLSLRYINSHLSQVGAGNERGTGTGYSLAVDAGVIYDPIDRLTLAATVTNLGPDIAYIDADQSDPLPRKLAVGFNYDLVKRPFHKLSVLGEADKLLVDLNDDITTEIEEIIPHLGMEYWYSNYVGLRTGYVYDDKGVQQYLTLGFSLQYNNYRFDFSYIPSSDPDKNRLGNTMRFSMNAGF